MALAPINAFQVILGFESSSTIIETLDSHTAELIIDKIIVNQNVGGGTGTPYDDSELRDSVNNLKTRVSSIETYIANQSNRPLLIQPLPDINFIIGSQPVVSDLSTNFANATQYSVDPSGQGVTITGSMMSVTASAAGNTNYTVTATDNVGQTASDTFSLSASVAPVAPSAFSSDDWGVTTGLQDRQIIFTINALPANGTAPISAIQYFVGGEWINFTDIATGSRVLAMPESDTVYEFDIRAVSSAGQGEPSGPKSARSGKEEVVNPDPVSGVISYNYMNSLFDHQYNGNADDDTRVPNWTNRMATQAGLTYQTSGRFGFAYQWPLPPDLAVTYQNVSWPPGIPGWTQTWQGMSVINMVTFVPDNFDSFSAPPHVNSTNPQSPVGFGRNYVERLLEMIDAWEANAPMANGEKRRYCVYAGWADFKPASGGGDWNTYTPAQLQTYLNWSFGDYQDWYVELVALLKAARPDLEIELLDIQRVMMDTWRNTALNTLTGARLWEDNSPHGTETWYLLAAIVYYMEIFKAKPPANFNPLAGAGEGSGVDPVLVDNWAAIVDYAWESLANATAPEQPASSGLLAVGLSGVTDYCASQPFINILKTARPWEARSSSVFTFLNPDQMISGGHVDSDRNPIRIPSGANRVGTLILTEINAEDTTMAGRYRLTWTGDGLVNVQAGQNTVYGDHWAEFNYTPNGTNLILIEVSSIDVANPIKFVSCINLRYTEIYEAGEIFRPEWIDLVKDFKLFRFMDWQKTNFSKLSAWNDRTRVTSFTWSRDVPVEVMVQLCNKLNVDAWFNFPHLATDDFIVNFATYVRDNLNDNLVARYEYSNEVWNWQFSQAQWARDQAAALWPNYLNQDGWMQFYGGKVAEMSMLLDTVYTGIQGRHIKVITTQTGYNGIENAILNAPRWVAMQAGRQAPKEYVDELAVTGYFGHSLSAENGTALVQDWRRNFGSEGTITRMRDKLISEINGLIASWSYLKPIADASNLDMVMYEGGTHIVPAYSYIASNQANYDATLFPFMRSFNYSDVMAELYIRAMTAFKVIGGKFFNIFVEVERASNSGFWGARRHTLDNNPRWNAIVDFNAGVETNLPSPNTVVVENWRLAINGPVVDSLSDTALVNQITTSPTTKTLSSWSTTRNIRIPVSATGNKGGLVVFYASDTATHTVEQSFNGNDWTPLTVRKGLVGGALPHRLVTIPSGPARIIRITGGGVSGFGLFDLPENGIPDLWLQAGASHTSSGAAPLAMRTAAIASFPNRDPIFVSYSESAQTSDTVTARILAGSEQVPEAKLCLAETGGNNVSQKKPFNPNDNLNLAGSIQNMLNGLAARGVRTYLESIAYRPYTETLNGARADLGSLPFNTEVVYPQIEALIPFAFDPDLRIARIDNYNLMWVHRDKFDTDNTHPSELAGYPIQRAFWVDTALRHAYTGQWPKAYAIQAVETAELDPTYAKWYNASVITRDLPNTASRTALIARVETPAVKEAAILNGATLEVVRAESVRTQISKNEAQAFVDRISDALYSTQKVALQSRLDAIVITTSRTVLVSFGVNAVAAPTQTSGSVSASGIKMTNISDLDGTATGWSLNVETGFGFTASSGGSQPNPNNTGYPLDLLLGYGSYQIATNPVFSIRGLNPAKRYRLASALSRASGTGRQTVTANGASATGTGQPFVELVIENITPIDLGGGLTGIRVALTTLDDNSAYAGFRLTESDPA